MGFRSSNPNHPATQEQQPCRARIGSRRLADLKTGDEAAARELCDRYFDQLVRLAAGNCGRHPGRCR